MLRIPQILCVKFFLILLQKCSLCYISAFPAPQLLTVKPASVSESTGYDGAKKIKGRKRHIAVDVLGLLLAVVVHSAAIAERSGAKLLMQRVRRYFPTLLKVWADGGYTGNTLQHWFLSVCNYILEIVKRPRKQFQLVKW